MSLIPCAVDDFVVTMAGLGMWSIRLHCAAAMTCTAAVLRGTLFLCNLCEVCIMQGQQRTRAWTHVRTRDREASDDSSDDSRDKKWNKKKRGIKGSQGGQQRRSFFCVCYKRRTEDGRRQYGLALVLASMLLWACMRESAERA